ncbi:hypothetical protein FRC02_005999, partial [Tulasnella sp. 418]
WITTSLPHDPTLPYRLHSSIFDTHVVTAPTTHPSHLQPYVYHLIVLMGNAAPPSYSDVADEKEIRQMLFNPLSTHSGLELASRRMLLHPSFHQRRRSILYPRGSLPEAPVQALVDRPSLPNNAYNHTRSVGPCQAASHKEGSFHHDYLHPFEEKRRLGIR